MKPFNLFLFSPLCPSPDGQIILLDSLASSKLRREKFYLPRSLADGEPFLANPAIDIRPSEGLISLALRDILRLGSALLHLRDDSRCEVVHKGVVANHLICELKH